MCCERSKNCMLKKKVKCLPSVTGSFLIHSPPPQFGSSRIIPIGYHLKKKQFSPCYGPTPNNSNRREQKRTVLFSFHRSYTVHGCRTCSSTNILQESIKNQQSTHSTDTYFTAYMTMTPAYMRSLPLLHT